MTTGLLTTTLDDPAAAPPGPGNPLPDSDVPFGDTLGDFKPLEYFLQLEVGGQRIWLKADSFSVGSGVAPAGQPFASSASVGFFGLTSFDPDILAALGSAEVGRVAQIEGYSLVGGVPRLVEEYRFENVVIDSFGSSGGSGLSTGQDVAFSFGRIQHGFITYDEFGEEEARTAFRWDFERDRSVTPRTINDDAPLSDPSLVDDDTGELSWFLRLGARGDWIEVGNVSVNTSSPVGIGDVATPGPLHITFGSDKAAPDLLAALTSGTRFGRLELEAYKEGAEPFLVAEYRFGFAETTQLSRFNSGDYYQSVNFSYRTISSVHISQDEDGRPAEISGPVGFDFRTNTVTDPNYAVRADAPLDARDTIGGVPAALEYFIEFDGLEGWIELSGFEFHILREASTGGGQPRSSAIARPVDISFGSDSLSPALFGKLVSGAVVARVEVEAYRTDGETPLLIDEYEFGQVVLTGGRTIGGGISIQSLKMSYETIEHAHVTYGSDGQPADVNRKGFDFNTNSALAASADAGELLF